MPKKNLGFLSTSFTHVHACTIISIQYIQVIFSIVIDRFDRVSDSVDPVHENLIWQSCHFVSNHENIKLRALNFVTQ